MSSVLEAYAVHVALQFAADKEAALHASARPAVVPEGRPALRVVDGDLAAEPPRLRRPGQVKPL